MYTANIRIGHFPSAWKVAYIIPIHKVDQDPFFPGSYRPISLLSTMAKLFEKIRLRRIDDITMDHPLIPNFQFGMVTVLPIRW